MFHEDIREARAVTNSKDLIGFPSGRSSVEEGGSLKLRETAPGNLDPRGEKKTCFHSSYSLRRIIQRYVDFPFDRRTYLLSNESFNGYKNNARRELFPERASPPLIDAPELKLTFFRVAA